MNLGIVRDVGFDELAQHGLRNLGDRTLVRSRERTPGNVILLSVEGVDADFRIDTVDRHPDHVVFSFITADEVWSKLDDEPWLQIEGGLVIAPQGIVHGLRCRGPWSLTVVFAPRSAVASFVPALPQTAMLHSDERLMERAMLQFVNGLLDSDSRASAIERYAIEQLLLEMAGTVLLDRIGAVGTQGSPREVLRDRAVAVIAQQCADPELSPAMVARDVQSSLRSLQAVFADAGNTVAGEIRRQRARLARSLLIDSRYDVLSIDQIATRSGFQSAMSLRRALDEAYRTTPRALRSGRGA